MCVCVEVFWLVFCFGGGGMGGGVYLLLFFVRHLKTFVGSDVVLEFGI